MRGPVSLLDKPAYLFRPSQIVRRLIVQLKPPRGTVVTRLPWGLPLGVEARDAIGQSVLHSGVYDLPLTEVLWRLVAPGDLALDAGANVGYTASVLATRAGRTGKVICFEPHPAVFARLESSVGRWRDRADLAPIALRQVALSDRAGRASLVEGDAFAGNLGTSSLAGSGTGGGNTIEVVTARLDDELAGASGAACVMKIDVEGHEAAVLAGATRTLSAHAVRDIVYEDHAGYPSSVSAVLEAAGYTVLAIGRTFLGPRLDPPALAPAARDQVAANFLATREPERALGLIAPRGWRCL